MPERFNGWNADALKGFSGVRTRFQRLSDYRFFSGWVQDAYGERVMIRAAPDVLVRTGEEFQFAMYGASHIAMFRSRLENGNEGGFGSSSDDQNVLELRQAILAAAEVDLEFTLLDRPRFLPMEEEARFLMQASRAEISFEGAIVEGMLADASQSGAGLYVEQKLPVGAAVELKVVTHEGEVRFHCEVRYCREDESNFGHFHVGLRIVEIGRVDRVKWNRLMA